MRLHHKHAGIKLLTLLLALAMMLGCAVGGTAFAATVSPEDPSSNSESVTLGSSLFKSSRYLTFSAHEDGVSLRLNEQISDKEYATATYTNELYMNNLRLAFKINDDIASELKLVFHSAYVQGAIWEYTPREVTHTLTLKNEGGKISASWDDSAAVATGFDFVGSELEVKVTDSAISLSSGSTVKEIGSTAGMFAVRRASLEFRFAQLGDRKIETDTDKQKATLYLEKIGYTANYKVGDADSYDEIEQNLKGESKVADTSRPIARIDTDKLPTFVKGSETTRQKDLKGQDMYYVPTAGQGVVPISASTCMDIVKSSITVKMKVKYAADEAKLSTDEAKDLAAKNIDGNVFYPDQEGYYAVYELSVSDGKNTVTLNAENGDSIDGVKLPLVYRAFPDSVDPVLENYGADFINQLNLTTLNGGTETPLQLPYPKMGSTIGNGVQLVEQIGTEKGNVAVKYYADNAKALTYKLSNKTLGSSTWSSNDSLTFSAGSTGWYKFHLQVFDLKNNRSGSVNDAVAADIFQLHFHDTNPLSLVISGFQSEKYLSQAVSLPSGSVTDPMGSTSATVEVFFTHKKVGDEYIEVFNCEWLYKMKDGKPIEENGEKVLDLDRDGFRQPALYTEDDCEGNTALVGKVIYIDNDGERLPYVEENGEWVCKDRVHERVSSSTSFTPKYLGKYRAVYSAKDSDGNKAEDITRLFEVVPQNKGASGSGTTSGSSFRLNTTSIVFLSIAGACAVAIVILLCIKPKDKEEK